MSSSLPVATREPSGLKAAAHTLALWPASDASSLPLFPSHSFLGSVARQIVWDVEGNSVKALSRVPWSGVHNEGGSVGNGASVPRRNFLRIDASDTLELSKIALEHFTGTLTDRHASLITDDLPIRASFSNPAAGVALSMGTLTIATTATGAGSVTLSDGVLTASYTFSNGDLVAAITSGAATAINASTGYRAAQDSGAAGVITIYYQGDRYARRLTSTITAAVGTTATEDISAPIVVSSRVFYFSPGSTFAPSDGPTPPPFLECAR